jgi:hypothetical protein
MANCGGGGSGGGELGARCQQRMPINQSILPSLQRATTTAAAAAEQMQRSLNNDPSSHSTNSHN